MTTAEYQQNTKSEALTLFFGVFPWAIAPAFAALAKLAWQDNLAVFVTLVAMAFASAIAAIKIGRAHGGGKSAKAPIRWGYWLGFAFFYMNVAVLAIAGLFAVWLFLVPK